MSGSSHPDIGPELRALAQAILERLDPAVRAAAAMAANPDSGPGKCQQVWCRCVRWPRWSTGSSIRC